MVSIKILLSFVAFYWFHDHKFDFKDEIMTFEFLVRSFG